MLRLKFTQFALLLLLGCGVISLSAQSITTAEWSSPTSGTIGTTEITLSGLVSPYITTSDLTKADFSFAPQSATEQTIDFDALSDWTITLSEPGDLYLYTIFWRGYTWEFDHDFTVVSGLSGITTPTQSSFYTSGGWGNGILLFENISSLTLSTDNSDNSGQIMTFGMPTGSAVPEPSTYGLLVGAITGIVAMTRRRNCRPPMAQNVPNRPALGL